MNTSKGMEDLIEDFVIECGSDSADEELVYNDDRQLIDNTLQTTTSTICTNPRHDLTDTIQQVTIILWLY